MTTPHKDFPDDIARRVMRIDPDNGGFYLWDLNGEAISAEAVGGSPGLDERFREWARRWDECFNLKTLKVDTAALASEHFDDRGLLLAMELKRAVGEERTVIYSFTLKPGRVEVLADGSVKEILDEQIAHKLA